MQRSSWVLGGFVAALFVTSSMAQAPAEQIPVYRLDLRKVEDIPEGNAALVAGEAGSRPDRFFLDNLYMLKPVSVTGSSRRRSGKTCCAKAPPALQTR
jgi:hypothetical protein